MHRKSQSRGAERRQRPRSPVACLDLEPYLVEPKDSAKMKAPEIPRTIPTTRGGVMIEALSRRDAGPGPASLCQDPRKRTTILAAHIRIPILLMVFKSLS